MSKKKQHGHSHNSINKLCMDIVCQSTGSRYAGMGVSLIQSAGNIAARLLGFPEPKGKGAAKEFLAANFGVLRSRVPYSTKKARSLFYESHASSVESGDVSSSDFLRTYKWRKLRMEALRLHGARCQCCGASPATGAVMNVDHIKPRKTHPHLALDINNLQILCHECNHGKGNWDTTDWRTVVSSEAQKH